MKRKKTTPLKSYQHEPTCAIIRETNPNAPLAQCTCSKKHIAAVARLEKRGNKEYVEIGPNQMSLGDGNYQRYPSKCDY